MHIGVGRMRVLYDLSEGCGGFGVVHGMGCGAPFVPQSSVEWVGVLVGVPRGFSGLEVV